MTTSGVHKKLRISTMLLAVLGMAVAMPSTAQPAPEDRSTTAAKRGDGEAAAGTPAKPAETASKKKPLDRSGEPRRGKASYYHKKFAGRTMADGTPMNPESNVAASRTLPLGTKAKVTNLENGKTSVVEIRDRGPYVDGRIVDLSPKVARKLEIEEQGVAPVEVKPIELPPSSNATRKAAADTATDASPEKQ